MNKKTQRFLLPLLANYPRTAFLVVSWEESKDRDGLPVPWHIVLTQLGNGKGCWVEPWPGNKNYEVEEMPGHSPKDG